MRVHGGAPRSRPAAPRPRRTRPRHAHSPSPTTAPRRSRATAPDAAGQQRDAERVGNFAAVRVARLAQQPPRGHEHRSAEEEVHEEHEPPVRPLDQKPAQRWPGRRRDAADRAPQRRGRRAPLRRELWQQQPQRGRDQQRRPGGLHDARADQHLDTRRKPTGGRRGEEQRHAGEEHPPASEQVREPPRGHQQRREDDVVRVQHPGQPGKRSVREREADAGERDVDDRHVEEGHEHGHTGDEQDLPAAIELLHATQPTQERCMTLRSCSCWDGPTTVRTARSRRASSSSASAGRCSSSRGFPRPPALRRDRDAARRGAQRADRSARSPRGRRRARARALPGPARAFRVPVDREGHRPLARDRVAGPVR